MATTTDVPVTITPEAAARAAELGIRADLDRMVEQARRTFPRMRRMDVILRGPTETDDDDKILIEVYGPPPVSIPDPEGQEWERWELKEFPADVLRWVLLLNYYEPADAR